MYVSTLSTILKDNWSWRKQVNQLAKFDMVKKSRGAALGRAWLFVRPTMYILVFWFALEVGLKQEHMSASNLPYIIWLMAGLIPWFFMQDQLGSGSNALKRYTYLVNKIKFPLSCIPTIVSKSNMLIEACLLVALFVIYLLCGGSLDVYLLQVPVIALLMYAFWWCFGVMCSFMSAMSKDFNQLLHALQQPLFWLSGVIFSVSAVVEHVPFMTYVFYIDPITFFAESMRSAFYYKTWIWQDPLFLIVFLVIFALQIAFMCFIYRRTHEEVADVL